jgi:hypothetical protein
MWMGMKASLIGLDAALNPVANIARGGHRHVRDHDQVEVDPGPLKVDWN